MARQALSLQPKLFSLASQSTPIAPYSHRACVRRLVSNYSAHASNGHTEKEGEREHLAKIVKNTRTCMFTTFGEHGIHARPMATANINFANNHEELFFFTEKASAKVAEIQKDQRVCLVFSDDSNNNWASITANAELITNNPSMFKELWSPALQAYFPGGAEDPNIALIKAVPTIAQYWDQGYATYFKILFAAARAKVTGEKVKGEELAESKTVAF